MDETGDKPRGFEEDGAAGAAARTGHLVIRDYLRRLEDRPGVYRMLDAKGDVLYVGKARNLKKRVAAYAKPMAHNSRIGRMIAATSSMMFLTTGSETEALLLEQNLIKQLKPRYNVLLRDDKSFPNIIVTADHAFPQIKKHRGLRKEPGRYFGPFASAGSVNRTLNQLQKAFLLRSCSDPMFESRTRPCLLYQIKRCSAPCVGYIDAPDYAALVEDAVLFLSGKSTRVQEQLAEAMGEASARDGVRARRRDPRPHPGADQRAGEPGHQPRGRRGGRRGGPAPGRRPRLRAGLLHPRPPELGQPRLLPAHRLGRRAGRDPRGVPRPVLRQQDPAAADPGQPRARQPRPALRRPQRPARPQGHDLPAAARREGGPRRAGGAQRPRGAGPAHGRERQPDGAARRPGRGLRARRAARAHRGLRQQPHHGHQRRRRHDRGRAPRAT